MAADTFACISQYVALATGDCDVLADGVVVGRLALGHHEDRTPTHGYAATREEAGAQPRRRSICFGNFLCERAIGCDPLRGCHNH